MKKALTMFLAAMMVLSLAACGSNSTPSNATTTNTENEENVATPSYDRKDLESILSAITTEAKTAAQTISDDSISLLDKLGESYDTYDANKTSVSDFYSNSLAEAETLYATLESISMDYFSCVAAQGLDDYDTWDGAMEDFYDAWDDGMEDYYDAWDNAYEDIYDQCDSLIEDASNDLDYSEYSNVWSEMYESYSDAWSSMYETYSDAWSKTYSNYSDVWSGFYNEETDVDAILKAAAEEDAQAESEGENTSDNSSETDTQSEPEGEGTSSNEPDPTPEETNTLIDDMRPEFKEAMDSYEAFFDEYVAFMEKYAASDGSDLTLLTDYANYMSKYADMMADFEAWDSEDMNTAETAYYIEVQSRISQKLLEVAEYIPG